MNARFNIALTRMTGGLVSMVQTTPPAAGIQGKRLWHVIGTIERPDHPNILRQHEALDQAGIKNVNYETPGTAHE